MVEFSKSGNDTFFIRFNKLKGSGHNPDNQEEKDDPQYHGWFELWNFELWNFKRRPLGASTATFKPVFRAFRLV